jgi:hypothetical protein
MLQDDHYPSSGGHDHRQRGNVDGKRVALAFVPNGVTFGPQTLGTSSGPMTVIITSVGTATVTTALVPARAARSVTFSSQLRFGSRSARITVNSDADNGLLMSNVAKVSLTVRWRSPASATDLNFGTGVIQFPTTRSLVVTNIGGSPLVIGTNVLAGRERGRLHHHRWCAGQTRQTPAP